MLAAPTLHSIYEQQEEYQGDVFLLKPSPFASTAPTILLSSPKAIYTNGHRRRSSVPSSKQQIMSATTSLDGPMQYWTRPVNFPPSPSASPAPSSRASSPEASPPSSKLIPVPSAPPSPAPSPPPYSVNDQFASPTSKPPRQQALGMPVGTETTTTTTTSLLDSPPSRLHKHQRPPVPHKPKALRLASSKLSVATSSSSSSSNGWRRYMHSGFTWIGLYFIFNMGLTLYNKTVLVHFPFPYSLTALHTLCGTIGCLWLRRIGYFTPARLTVRQNLTLAAFSVLYTLNIAVSNLSLQLVTVPFHQVVRASAPFFTILVAYILGASKGKGILGVPASKLLSLLPVIAGVGFATYGDYSFTTWGFILTLFGTFLAALKTVLTSILQTPSASSRLSTPLPVATPATAQPGYDYGFPPSPSASTSTLPNGHRDGNVTPPKSPYLSAHPHPQYHHHHHQQTRTPSHFHSWSSSLAKRFAPIKHLLFKRFGFVTKRFDLDFGLSNQSVVSTSIKLHPLDLLMRMSPLAFVQCVGYAWVSGELDRAMVHKGPGMEGWSQKSATVLLLNGVIAFLLNIVSLTANQKNGPLTMTVAANVKQVLTILLAMYMFHLAITPANTIGIALTLAGGAWYGALEYEEKKHRLRMV